MSITSEMRDISFKHWVTTYLKTFGFSWVDVLSHVDGVLPAHR